MILIERVWRSSIPGESQRLPKLTLLTGNTKHFATIESLGIEAFVIQ